MSDSLKFYLVTDTHHHSLENGRFDGHDQQCINETGVIIDTTFKMLADDKDIDIVLVDGDLSRNGRKNEHSEFLEKLKRLKAAGKRVFVITATHDYGLRSLDDGYTRDSIPDDLVFRDDLREMYFDYGRQEAIAEHLPSMSYAVQLAEGYRLLCLNDDGDGKGFCGYDEDEMQWILAQIEAAKAAGDYIFAITHHPVLPPSPIYPLFSKRDMLGKYEEASTILADAGLEFIFTGHTHMQNIAVKTTDNGNKIYDINTGSLVGYPSAIRLCELDDEKMTVNTLHLDNVDIETGGRSFDDYLKYNFDFMLNDIFDSMAFDFDHFADKAGSFSMSREQVLKLKTPIKLLGKILQKLTFAKASRLLFCRKCVDDSVKDVLLKDFIVEAVRNVYGGDEPYSPDTPTYKAITGIIAKATPLVKKFVKDSPIVNDLPGLIASIIYDAGPHDSDEVLPRQHKLQK